MIVRTAVVVVCLAAAVVQAQNPPARQAPPWTPPDPMNLQVFPKDIAKRELIQRMKGFTGALGVRCEFCHVGQGDDLAAFDFASDEKREKRNARLMLQMTADINMRLADIPEPRPAGTPAVTCYTCHRGEKKPQIERPQ